jgi:tRNA(Arg) A34 adenosine deaminase TadA
MSEPLPQDVAFLRQAIALARLAREGGADPFGAVLAYDGRAVAASSDRSVALSDPTAHAELDVIRSYCRQAHCFALEGYTLYCSAEPCAMCAGAIHWARISRVVFSVPQADLQRRSGGRPKLGCAAIINSGHRRVEIVGPLLREEGLAVFAGYDWPTKVARHQALFGRAEKGTQ